MRIEKCECECLEVSTSLQLSSSNETSPKFDPTSSATEDNRWNWLKDCNNWKHHCRTRWKKIARGTLAADLKRKQCLLVQLRNPKRRYLYIRGTVRLTTRVWYRQVRLFVNQLNLPPQQTDGSWQLSELLFHDKKMSQIGLKCRTEVWHRCCVMLKKNAFGQGVLSINMRDRFRYYAISQTVSI